MIQNLKKKSCRYNGKHRNLRNIIWSLKRTSKTIHRRLVWHQAFISIHLSSMETYHSSRHSILYVPMDFSIEQFDILLHFNLWLLQFPIKCISDILIILNLTRTHDRRCLHSLRNFSNCLHLFFPKYHQYSLFHNCMMVHP